MSARSATGIELHIRQVENWELLIPFASRWDELAGDCVFRRWTWLNTWWKHYGSTAPAASYAHSEHRQSQPQLRVYLVFAEGELCEDDPLVAILPCYLEQSFARGRVLRLLGDGEVCSEHLDLLATESFPNEAAEVLADYLVSEAGDWDLIDLTVIGEQRTGIHQLAYALETLGCQLHRKTGPNCWTIDLPENWEIFLGEQSKSHRKQLRRLERRVLDAGHAKWHLVEKPEDFEKAWRILIDLHQRRRQSLDEPGCFASSQWAGFHREVAEKLLSEGRLRLSWLELDGQPVAAEYHFADNHATYAYQGGVEPEMLGQEPGKLSMIRALQQAIGESHRRFELLRGDEPYKAHWRASAESSEDLQIVAPRSAANWRYRTWNATRRVGKLARQFTNLLS